MLFFYILQIHSTNLKYIITQKKYTANQIKVGSKNSFSNKIENLPLLFC